MTERDVALFDLAREVFRLPSRIANGVIGVA